MKLESIIYSDGWKAYSGLQNLGYTHCVVNHSRHFVDPATGAHTNTIESTWSGVKAKTPIQYRTVNSITPCLEKFIWKREKIKTCRIHFLSRIFEKIHTHQMDYFMQP